MGRTGQRLAVIAVAVAVIAAAGLWNARSQLSLTGAPVASSTSPTLSGPYSVTYDFMTPKLGWALAVDIRSYNTRVYLFRSTDGGVRWDRQFTGRAVGDRTFLQFFDAQNGFAYAGYTYRTNDGGDHWQTVNVPGARPYVTFASPLYGWAENFASGASRLYRTVDGGRIWTQVGTAPVGAAVLQPANGRDTALFRVDCEGWLGAAGKGIPLVFVTTDCGTSWEAIEVHFGGPIDPDNAYATSVRVMGSGTVVVFEGGDTQLFSAALSSDAGAAWHGLDLPAPLDSPEQLSLVDPAHWWMFRAGVIYTTDHAGSPWNTVFASGLPRGWQFESGQGVDATHAWMSLVSSSRSDLRALAVTSDRGQHWQLVGTPVP